LEHDDKKWLLSTAISSGYFSSKFIGWSLTMRKFIGWLGVAIIVSAFVAGFFAYFIFRLDPLTGIIYDGFGRPQYESPWIIRIVLQEGHWAGWTWFIADMFIFWSSLAVGITLARWGLWSKSR
jgi:hypothetical protein